MKRIYLIDCPGVVPPSNGDSEQDILLRGVVRVENVENPAQYIPAVLRIAQTKHIERTYEIKFSEYNDDANEFLSILARKGGRLLRGGEADVDGVAKMVLNDFLRGKIPWFSAPPKKAGGVETDEQKGLVEGREGRLGEMPSKGQKRKRDEVEAGTVEPDARNDADVDAVEVNGDEDDAQDEFEHEAAEDDVDDVDDDDDGVDLDEEFDQDSMIKTPFETFSSDEEEEEEEEDRGSRDVPAG
jgi:nuclear GTP-binding protein